MLEKSRCLTPPSAPFHLIGALSVAAGNEQPIDPALAIWRDPDLAGAAECRDRAATCARRYLVECKNNTSVLIGPQIRF
jgi:hypothetical protein